jgi:hypothetical protein
VGIEADSAFPQYSAGEEDGDFLIENNLMYDLAARLTYSDGDPSLFTGTLGAAARDIIFRHNTAGLAYGDMPLLIYGNVSGVLTEGLSYTDNLVYMSYGIAAGIFSKDGDGLPNHFRLPRVKDDTYKSMLDTSYVRLNSLGQFVPNYTFSRNVIIGGRSYLGEGQQQKDMDDPLIQYLQKGFPSGNIFPATGTDSLSDREHLVGLTDPKNWNYRLLPSSPYAKGGLAASADGSAIGVDYDRLESDLGLVTNIAPVTISSSTAQFQYTAPDANTCAVDVTADGVNWTRTADSGGDRQRTVNVSPVNAQTSYQYRILCYYLQMNDGTHYTDYTPSQLTNGTFSSSALPQFSGQQKSLGGEKRN